MSTLRVPVLGRISAGTPMVVPDSDFAYLDASEAIDVSADVLPEDVDATELFALQVLGNGLEDVSITDGDLAVLQALSPVDQESVAQVSGADIVAIWFPDRREATLTRLHRLPEGYALRAATAAMRPIRVRADDPLEVKGKVVAVIRRMRD